MTQVFLVNTYRELLEGQIKSNKHVRGYKTQLAKAAGCHSSYLSQVLSGSMDLTLEQGTNLATFWELSEAEIDYFLDLLLRDRAASPSLKKVIERRLKNQREQYDLAARVYSDDRVLGEEDAGRYYASWHYAAVKVLAPLREYASVQQIADCLHITAELVSETLVELEEMKLLKRDGKRWVAAEQDTYLPRGSHMTSTNHCSWRQRAIFKVQSRDVDALHLLHVCSVAREDVAAVKEKLLCCLEEVRKIAKRSQGDDGMAIALDFFRF